MTIWTCPDCDTDLIHEAWDLWCPTCEQTVSFPRAMGPADDDNYCDPDPADEH